MSTLAHALEEAGIATVALSLNREHSEQIRPPRTLFVDFPLGRPLGKPADSNFQREVLMAAFALLERNEGPVLEDFPISIEDATDTPLACPMPPRTNAKLHPAVDEAKGLRDAWERSYKKNGGTQIGRSVGVEDIEQAISCFVKIAEGQHWQTTGLMGSPIAVAMDIRMYYEEAAQSLVEHIPAARASESWLYQCTETGALLKQAQIQLRDVQPGFKEWLYILPITQQ